jgi:hypothetical protein
MVGVEIKGSIAAKVRQESQLEETLASEEHQAEGGRNVNKCLME